MGLWLPGMIACRGCVDAGARAARECSTEPGARGGERYGRIAGKTSLVPVCCCAASFVLQKRAWSLGPAAKTYYKIPCLLCITKADLEPGTCSKNVLQDSPLALYYKSRPGAWDLQQKRITRFPACFVLQKQTWSLGPAEVMYYKIPRLLIRGVWDRCFIRCRIPRMTAPAGGVWGEARSVTIDAV